MSSLVISGDTSGAITLQAPAISGATTLNLPTTSGTLLTSASGTAVSATNLSGGSAGVIPFQTGSGATSFTAVGTAGQLLTSAGTGTPTWTAAFSLSANNTFTGTQTFSGSASATGVVLNDVAEVATISATAATGTVIYDITTQSVLYYTSNASANWTMNFRASSGTSLNTLMAIGQSMTVAFLVTIGTTQYRPTVFQVDGTAVTPKWQGGTAPTTGNANSIDVYVFTIIKTASATFTVLASQTKFA